MRHFTAPPQLELAGYMTAAFIENMESHETRPIFEKHGLIDLDPTAWYPATAFMDAMNDLIQHGNISSNLVAIGLQIGERTPFPPEVRTLDDVLNGGWANAYHSVHRHHKGATEIGEVVAEKLSDTHYRTIHNHLYPDDFSYGILYGFAKRFLPPGTDFRVFYDAEAPQRDRDNAPTTVIHITWK